MGFQSYMMAVCVFEYLLTPIPRSSGFIKIIQSKYGSRIKINYT